MSSPDRPDKSNVALDPMVNAALGHIADSLGVTKSAYIEAVLRVKFALSSDQLAIKNIPKEGIYQHVLNERGRPPPELASFDYKIPPAQKRKSGRRPLMQESLEYKPPRPISGGGKFVPTKEVTGNGKATG